MNQVLKQAKQIQVACTERENGEDPAGDTEFAPVALTFHLSTQHAVRATLASQSENQQAQVNMAVGRINKLRVEVPRLIEVRQVIMPLQMSAAERLENITRAFMLVLTNRATDILDTMEIEENDTKGSSAMWEKARTGARQCIVSVIELTVVTVGSERLCNYVFKLLDPAYVEEILGYDNEINRIMETVGKITRIEMRMVDPDNTPDGKQLRAYEAKHDQEWSKKSTKDLSKIKGKWTNPMTTSQSWNTGVNSRSGDKQGGVDIRFTQNEIQRQPYNAMNNQSEAAMEARCSAMQRQYDVKLKEITEEFQTLKKDINEVHASIEKKNMDDDKWKREVEHRQKESSVEISRHLEAVKQESKSTNEALAEVIKMQVQAPVRVD